ncbi:hypothetical protein NL676_035218 [Syzygium grande]|nr:hypothetical protein NL676_035218 [Syzygium grande]
MAAASTGSSTLLLFRVIRLKPRLASVSLSDDHQPSDRLHSTKPPSFSSSGDGHPEMILRFCETKRGRCEA